MSKVTISRNDLLKCKGAVDIAPFSIELNKDNKDNMDKFIIDCILQKTTNNTKEEEK